MESSEPQYAAYVKLPHSLKASPEMTNLGISDSNEIIDVTILLRRRKPIEEIVRAGTRVSHEQFENDYGASPEDIEKVVAFAHHFNLSILETHIARRTVILKGKAADLSKAFQVYLSSYRDKNGNVFRGRNGHVHIPAELAPVIEGVFGLDNRPHARPMFQAVKQDGMFVSHLSGQGYTPKQVADIYGFPEQVNGSGECIGIIELGGGYRSNDLDTYFSGLGMTAPVFSAISVDGGHNAPSVADSSDGEVMLDIEVAGAVAPGAKIVVYFANNTDKGFLDAITTAIHDTQNNPSVISISWGSAEVTWTEQSLNSYNEAFKSATALGVTICAAAGDSGSSDGVFDGKVHVDFPASSPYVLACGGTCLIAENNKVVSETVWNESRDSATGGGVSDFFPLPDYQQNANVPLSLNAKFKGRGVPDVAGNAATGTGYKVLVDGEEMVIGGTSAVAPLYAALVALLNQQKGKRLGFINPVLYTNAKLCRDITQGDNMTTNAGFSAKQGWDACTGLGVLSSF